MTTLKKHYTEKRQNLKKQIEQVKNQRRQGRFLLIGCFLAALIVLLTVNTTWAIVLFSTGVALYLTIIYISTVHILNLTCQIKETEDFLKKES